VIADHSDALATIAEIINGNPYFTADPTVARWHEMITRERAYSSPVWYTPQVKTGCARSPQTIRKPAEDTGRPEPRVSGLVLLNPTPSNLQR
jgi:hypothetical protein